MLYIYMYTPRLLGYEDIWITACDACAPRSGESRLSCSVEHLIPSLYLRSLKGISDLREVEVDHGQLISGESG